MARPTNEARVLIAQRRTRVLAMRIENVPYEQIAAALNISEAVAEKDYQRARDEAAAQLDATTAKARELELLRLAAMEREAWAVLRRRHIVIQQGKVVRDEDDNTIEDDAPVLQAIDRLERISARRARMLGLDAPAKVEVSGEVDDAIAALASRLGAVEPGGEAQAAGDAAAG